MLPTIQTPFSPQALRLSLKLTDVSQVLTIKHYQDLIMGAVSAFQMLAKFCHNTQLNIPEDSHLHTPHSKNLKSHIYKHHPWYSRGMYFTSSNDVHCMLTVSEQFPYNVQTFHLHQSRITLLTCTGPL
jgi:hypothetical protein